MDSFPNDLHKDSIRRFLARLGLRIQKSDYLPFSYTLKNFPAVSPGSEPVIFDVGGNIGQSSVWFAKEFPGARTHASNHSRLFTKNGPGLPIHAGRSQPIRWP
jgi:hypothetical protein